MFRQQQNQIALGARIDRFAQDHRQAAKTDCYGLKDYVIAPFYRSITQTSESWCISVLEKVNPVYISVYDLLITVF